MMSQGVPFWRGYFSLDGEGNVFPLNGARVIGIIVKIVVPLIPLILVFTNFSVTTGTLFWGAVCCLLWFMPSMLLSFAICLLLLQQFDRKPSDSVSQ